MEVKHSRKLLGGMVHSRSNGIDLGSVGDT